MDQALKQRLVGAVVVIAALVVAIPAFLGGGRSGDRTVAVEIPEAPTPENETRLLSLNGADDSQALVPPRQVRAQPVLAPAPEDTAALQTGKAETNPEIAAAERELADAPTPVHAPVPNAQPPSAAKPPADELGRRGHAPQVGFAVQLGGFSKQKNALSLQSMLRKAGYDAYVEAIQRGAQTLYRVRVGPRLKRTDAQQLLQGIRKKIGIDGIIVPAS